MSIELDSNTIYWPSTLPTPLIGRQLNKDPRTWVTQMDSNRNRNRPTGDGAMVTMNVNWNFLADEYAAFKDFFENTLIQGTQIFVMETLEQDDDPEVVRDTLYQLAFYTATYQWTQDDGVFSVSATLQVNAQQYTLIPNPFFSESLETVTVNYPTTCQDIFTFSWTIDEHYTQGLDVIQTAANVGGPWYDWLSVPATPDEMLAGSKTLQINNTFQGKRWFRRVRNGFPTTYPFKPAASVIPPFDLDIVATLPSDFPILSAGPYPRPISYAENQWINPLPIYVEPRERLQYNNNDPFNNWDGIRTTVTSPNVSNPDGLRWTRDGSDPTEDMLWPPPVIEGYNYNARIYASDFSGCIKARCFDGECSSPMVLYIIDKKMEILPLVTLNGRAASGGGGVCTVPIIDEHGNTIRSVLDCQNKYGGEDGLVQTMVNSLCEQLDRTPPVDANEGPVTVDGKMCLFLMSGGVSGIGEILVGTELWPGVEGGAYRFFFDFFEPIYYADTAAKQGYWDTVPRLFEVSTISSAGDSQKVTVARPYDTTYKNFAGVPGSLSWACAANTAFLDNLMDSVTCGDTGNLSRTLDSMYLYVTPVDDEWDGVARTPPVIPAPPTPPAPIPPDQDYQELWDEYVDSMDASVGTYALGTGWGDAWTISDAPLIEGDDNFESYPSIADNVQINNGDLNLGTNWTGSGWVVNEYLSATNSGLEDWEVYSAIDDGDVSTLMYLLNKNSGWAQFDITQPNLGLVAWSANQETSGVDDWQSYADGIVSAGATGLNWNDGYSWYYESQWYVNE